MDQWYALYTKPNCEYQVARLLRQRGMETYLPYIEPPKVNGTRKRSPLFPCYLFMKADLETVSPARWLWTPGLRRIVSFGDQPVPVPDEVINLIRRKLVEIETSGIRSEYKFKPGEVVRITDGPFHDMLAVFDRPVSPGERVQILLHVLGRASRVRIDVSDVEKAPPGASAQVSKKPRRTRGRGRRIRR